jgi:UDP-N-acetyl-D-glucosamine dehydrogenase
MDVAVDQKQGLMERFRSRAAKIGVVGLGYVGLPFAVEKAKVGFQVIGIDANAARCDQVNRGENYISDVEDEELRTLVEQGLITATSSFDVVPDLDVIVIAVPTPLTKNLGPDLQFVVGVSEELSNRIRPGQLISLESTTYPGTTEEVMLPILTRSGLKADVDFYLAHSPERVDPGNRKFTTKNTNKVVGGIGPNSLEVAVEFYQQAILHIVPVSSAKTAELVKVYENTFRAVNIALVNELTLLCDRLQLNVWEVLDAAFTKPFGIMPFYPGPGVGGHCIPLDPHYLEWKAKEVNFNTRFINLAGEVNRKMPEFVVEKAMRVMNAHGKAISRCKVLVLGVAYKKNISDERESPGVEVIHQLVGLGAEVAYHDPYVANYSHAGRDWESVPLTEAALREADLVIVITEHTNVDYAHVAQHAQAVLDTRNALRKVENRENITVL